MVLAGPARIVAALLLGTRWSLHTSLETRREDIGVSAKCPIDLLDVKATESLRLHEDGIRYLAALPSPVYLVPMLGVYRGGKSMLLCRLMQLQAPYANGFGIGHGQQTFTRGIQVCAEEVSGLGSVVWMDTEGLFSSEDAEGAYGPKIFSLALLFSSTVLINSVKVLNEQFFSFFAEQQRIARTLKHGLITQGLPADSLMPRNLSVFWVLQQPVHFHNSSAMSQRQLEEFLSIPDETRARVRRDFHHSIHEIPPATYDMRAWTSLDRVPDSELADAYVIAAEELRSRVFVELRSSRAMRASGVVKQLEMFLQVVQTQNFSGALAQEVFEEAQMGSLCGDFATIVEEVAGILPSSSLEIAFTTALEAIEKRRTAAIESFHFDQSWSMRLDTCIQEERAKFEYRNSEALLTKWQGVASQVAEDTSCFFLGEHFRLLTEFEGNYSHSVTATMRERALEFSYALQRTRLRDCVLLRDVVKPFIPWLLWPVCKGHLQSGLISGIMSLLVHAVLLSGIYGMLQMFGQVPAYLDINYPVLRMHPILLDSILLAPASIPWEAMVKLFSIFGAIWSAWKLLARVFFHRRPSAERHVAMDHSDIQCRLDMLVKSSEAAFRQRLREAALDVADLLDRGCMRSASSAILKALIYVRESSADVDAMSGQYLDRVNVALDEFCAASARRHVCAPEACVSQNLIEAACCGTVDDILATILDLFELMASADNENEHGSPALSHNFSSLASPTGETSCTDGKSPCLDSQADAEVLSPEAASRDTGSVSRNLDKSFINSSVGSTSRNLEKSFMSSSAGSASRSLHRSFMSSSACSGDRSSTCSQHLDETQSCTTTACNEEAGELVCRGASCQACRLFKALAPRSAHSTRASWEYKSPDTDGRSQHAIDDQSRVDSELSCEASCNSASPEAVKRGLNRLQWTSPRPNSLASPEVSQSSETSVMHSPTPLSHLRGRRLSWSKW